METKIQEIILKILQRNNWGIYFKGNPLQELPVSEEPPVYRINSVRDEAIRDAISEELSSIIGSINSEGDTECNQEKTTRGLGET